MWFRIIVFITIAILVMIFGFSLFQMYPSEQPLPAEQQLPRQEEKAQTYTVLDKIDLIKVENPQVNQTITSPLTIKGEARGYWFFEADFPIRLMDGNGEELAIAIATAQSDWMTEDFVPFEAILEFENPGTEEGTLVLEKDNPSGLLEHADELRIPVNFK